MNTVSIWGSAFAPSVLETTTVGGYASTDSIIHRKATRAALKSLALESRPSESRS